MRALPLERPSPLDAQLAQLGPPEVIEDYRFGEIEVYYPPNDRGSDRVLFSKTSLLSGEAVARSRTEQLEQRMAVNHFALLRMLDFSVTRDPGRPDSFRVVSYFEYPPSDLEYELNERRAQGLSFTSDELFALAHDVLQALSHLQSMDMIHGDLRPKYIFLAEHARESSLLLDRMSEEESPARIQLANIRRGDTLYASPVLYNSLRTQQIRIRHNPFKSEIFSLGLIVLECGVGHSVQEVFGAVEVNVERLLDFVEEFIERHEGHGLLVDMLIAMLDVEERERMEAAEVLELVTEQTPKDHGEAQEVESMESPPPDDKNGVSKSSRSPSCHTRLTRPS